jgi:hypothetical protein
VPATGAVPGRALQPAENAFARLALYDHAKATVTQADFDTIGRLACGAVVCCANANEPKKGKL